MRPIRSDKEALTLGLYLSLTAPTEEKYELVSSTLDGLAYGMTKEVIEKCKRAALARVRRDDIREHKRQEEALAGAH